MSNSKPIFDYNSNILTPKEVYKLEGSLTNSGLTVESLMESAVLSAKTYLLSHYPQVKKVLVLAGCGNNGADGMFLAKELILSDVTVDVALLGASQIEIELIDKKSQRATKYSNLNIKAQNQLKKSSPNFIDLYKLTSKIIEKYELIVDAVFGIGGKVSRDTDFIQLASLINTSNKPVFTIDIASGSSGYDGMVAYQQEAKNKGSIQEELALKQPSAIKSDLCLTFFSRKTGQILTPAKSLYSKIIIDNLGLKVDEIAKFQQNFQLASIDPDFQKIYQPKISDNKYSMGHLAIIAGDKLGASILASLAAINSACGIVTIFIPNGKNSNSIAKSIAITHPNIITKTFNSTQDFSRKIIKSKVGCLLIGPGLGQGFDVINFIKELKSCFDHELSSSKIEFHETGGARKITSFFDLYKVFDAEALQHTLIKDRQVLEILDENTVLTPHMGEFRRLTDLGQSSLSRLEQLMSFYSNNSLKSMLILKGNDSIFLYQNQPIVISDQASTQLAKAGSGDILAGLISGFLAQTSQKKSALISSIGSCKTAKQIPKLTSKSLNYKVLKAVLFMQGQLPKYNANVIDQVRLCYHRYVLS